jgi:hypothetical protein
VPGEERPITLPLGTGAAGKGVRTPRDYWAFVPVAPLSILLGAAPPLFWPIVGNSGMLSKMAAVHSNDISPIPSAPFDDLDLDRDEDEEEWERRVMDLASARIVAARARLERLGIIDSEGKLVSNELPPDMLPGSDTTLETG